MILSLGKSNKNKFFFGYALVFFVSLQQSSYNSITEIYIKNA